MRFAFVLFLIPKRMWRVSSEGIYCILFSLNDQLPGVYTDRLTAITRHATPCIYYRITVKGH